MGQESAGSGLKIEWLPLASANRFEQLDYIAQDNPLAAIDQDERIEHQIDMLLQHPQMGRPGRKKGTRELVISRTPFVVVYRAKGPRIEIIRLLHGAQQWPGGKSGPARWFQRLAEPSQIQPSLLGREKQPVYPDRKAGQQKAKQPYRFATCRKRHQHPGPAKC